MDIFSGSVKKSKIMRMDLVEAFKNKKYMVSACEQEFVYHVQDPWHLYRQILFSEQCSENAIIRILQFRQ